ncbi:hypothetical protein AgCh_015904 [Apium graveolens]
MGNEFKIFLHNFGIQQKFSSFALPQGNEAVETANKVIFQGIKKRLGEAKGKYADELLWVFMLKNMEVGLDSYQSEIYNVENNDFGLKANVDLLVEEREATHKRNLKYLLQAAQHYDSCIKKDHSHMIIAKLEGALLGQLQLLLCLSELFLEPLQLPILMINAPVRPLQVLPQPLFVFYQHIYLADQGLIS